MTQWRTNSKRQARSVKALHLLSPLRRTREGEVLYAHLYDMLEHREDESFDRAQALTGIIDTLIRHLNHHIDCGPAEHMHLQILHMRLQDQPSAQELATLKSQLDDLCPQSSEKPKTSQNESGRLLEDTLSSLLDGLRSDNSGIEKMTDMKRCTTQEHHERAGSVTEKRSQQDEATSLSRAYARDMSDEWHDGHNTRRGASTPPVSLSSNNPDEDRGKPRFRLRNLQRTLERQLSDVIDQNDQFARLLDVEQTTLKGLNNVTELDALRNIMIDEIGNLMRGHYALKEKLEHTRQYIDILENEGEELSSELSRAMHLSLTDDLTLLPNRRAFIRQLEDEVARVQRYKYPLTVALLDLDHFKCINDSHGHAAGDEALRRFSACASSVFRHHDMIARYGGEEFAIVLPNTHIEGAQKALKKVSDLVKATRYTFMDQDISLPTFSGGIALYKPGETTGNLIERADKALYRAKRTGRNRIETDDDADTINHPLDSDACLDKDSGH